MAVEKTEGGMVITGPHIEAARLIALRLALRMEIKTGMKLHRNRSASQVITDSILKPLGVVEPNKRPNKETVYRLFNALLVDNGFEDHPL